MTAKATLSLSPRFFAGITTICPIAHSLPVGVQLVEVAAGLCPASAVTSLAPMSTADALAGHGTSLSTATVSAVGVAQPGALATTTAALTPAKATTHR